MLEFARVLVCCSFHPCDSHPSTSLQLRGVRVQSISLKSHSAISYIDCTSEKSSKFMSSVKMPTFMVTETNGVAVLKRVMFCVYRSFFQSVCVLGYCVLPLAVALILCRIILIIQPQTTLLFALRSVLVLLAFAWSTFGKCGDFHNHSRNRRIKSDVTNNRYLKPGRCCMMYDDK